MMKAALMFDQQPQNPPHHVAHVGPCRVQSPRLGPLGQASHRRHCGQPGANGNSERTPVPAPRTNVPHLVPSRFPFSIVQNQES
jgi:hypothetical protein